MKIPVVTPASIKIDHRVSTEKNKQIMTPILVGIQEALDKVNGSARSFTIFSAEEVVTRVVRAEMMLINAGVTKKNRGGTIVKYRPAGPYAKAYGNSAVSTLVTFTRTTTGTWYMTNVTRCNVFPKQPELFSVTISKSAREDIIRKATENFSIEPAKE